MLTVSANVGFAREDVVAVVSVVLVIGDVVVQVVVHGLGLIAWSVVWMLAGYLETSNTDYLEVKFHVPREVIREASRATKMSAGLVRDLGNLHNGFGIIDILVAQKLSRANAQDIRAVLRELWRENSTALSILVGLSVDAAVVVVAGRSTANSPVAGGDDESGALQDELHDFVAGADDGGLEVEDLGRT